MSHSKSARSHGDEQTSLSCWDKIKACFCCRNISCFCGHKISPLKNKEIFIHGHAIGGILETDTRLDESGLRVYRHILKMPDNGPENVARKMNLKDGDELLELNKDLLPLLTPEQVLKGFQNIKTDGRTNTVLTVGRKEDTYFVSDNQAEMRNASNTRTNMSTRTNIPEVSYSRTEMTNASNSISKITPVSDQVHAVKRLCCKFECKGGKCIPIDRREPENDDGFSREIESVHKYQLVPQPSHFIMIEGQTVKAGTRDDDILKTLKYHLDGTNYYKQNGYVHFDGVTLSNIDKTQYICLNVEENRIEMSGEPEWFKISMNDSQVHFSLSKLQGRKSTYMYIGYHEEEQMLMPLDQPCKFEEVTVS
ncbi:uncharacterized protein LOC132759761 [Ruditapes philippinarum]|uniref:uncharacterized protein LOC132759761 n=1 Tax=Ruditapes philippinarum TaxID=129788 RepID=UPI00295B8566|nr:uncharacterized protein LOC132759761 [Ruditapes philippinarum]